MDTVEIASREAHIQQLEAKNRQLIEQANAIAREVQLRDDMLAKLQKQIGQEWHELTHPRDKRILELERDNTALRKQEAANLAIAREHRDRYDALCNELGALGVDIPKLRDGKIKVVPA